MKKNKPYGDDYVPANDEADMTGVLDDNKEAEEDEDDDENDEDEVGLDEDEDEEEELE